MDLTTASGNLRRGSGAENATKPTWPTRPTCCGFAAARVLPAGFPRRAQHLLLVATLGGLTGCTIHPSGPHGPACPIIEDASHIIEYPSQRLRILKGVAARPSLSTHEQIYLVNAVMAAGFSLDKAEALITLIRNPCCALETRQHVRKWLKFSRMLGRDERRVVDELDRASAPSTQPAG